MNILYFEDYTFKFDPIHSKIGILKSLNDLNNHEVLIEWYKIEDKIAFTVNIKLFGDIIVVYIFGISFNINNKKSKWISIG